MHSNKGLSPLPGLLQNSSQPGAARFALAPGYSLSAPLGLGQPISLQSIAIETIREREPPVTASKAPR
jgi:hypothetical protein